MRSSHAGRCALFFVIVLAISAACFAQVGISITIGPPPLPVYEQPPCPEEGYIWTPGYWAYDYDAADYYWVPGTWVLAPEPGYLWTPAYWGWSGDRFLFHEGYWGPHVGFYGGINYGYGYFGNGYEGGRWDHDRFFYNRSVNNVNVVNIHNVYNTTIVNRTVENRISYNGGNGGINARPNAEQEAAMRDRHLAPVAAQHQHMQAAQADREQRASVNHGRPAITASPKPGVFAQRGVAQARETGAANNRAEPQQRGAQGNFPHPGNAVHPGELPAHERPAAPNTGNQKLDQKYQQQQEKLVTKQNQEHQKLQQRQDQEHQQMARQNADEGRKQQVEQRHQQQTQQLEEKHVQQQQHLEQRQQPANHGQPRQH